MMAQGVYILALCLNLTCTDIAPIKVFRHKDMCILAKAHYEYIYPQLNYICTQEGDA
jgi:hypothetical protein